MSSEEIYISQRNIKGIKRSRLQRPRKVLLNKPFEPFKLSSHTLYPTPEYFKKNSNLVSIIIPMYKSTNVIKDQIENWCEDDLDYEIIYVDDNCPLASRDMVVNCWNKKQRKVGKIVYCNKNNGYGASCNIGSYYASGKYLIFLNADTKVTKNWLKPIVDLLEDKSVGIVGNLQLRDGGAFNGYIDGAGSEWSWDRGSFLHIGRDSYKGKILEKPMKELPDELKEVQEREMVTGCCIGIRSDLFKEIGGFNLNYRIGYWEDSELCMSIKEKGYKILYQPNSIIYHKGSHTCSGGHPYMKHNQIYFENKWIKSNRIDNIVKEKRTLNEIKNISINREASHGDVLIASAVAAALKKKYPGVKINFITPLIEVLYKNPYIDEINGVSKTDQVSYDLNLSYEYRPYSNLLECYADYVGVKVEDCDLFLYDSPGNLTLPSDCIILHCDKTDWVGRNWFIDGFQKVATELRKLNHNVVLIGKSNYEFKDVIDLRNKTDIQQTAYLIKRCKLFFGIDSFPFHISQVFNIPSVVFFGSIDPKTRIISKNVTPIIANGLNCLGCHHEQPIPCLATKICKMKEELCQSMVSPEFILNEILKRINL